MDIQKDYSCLEHNRCVLKKTLDAENDFQETLPAYCDDIYKVIKCVAKNSIQSAEINYNEVVISCRCRIYLTYLNENGNLCFADFEEEYTRSVNADDLSDTAFVHALINEKYINFRVINQRRIDVHSAAVITVAVYDMVKYPCLVGCENARLKKEKLRTLDIIGSVITKMEFDEEFTVPSDSEQIRRIVSFCAYAYVTDTKIIKDKALVKVNVMLEVLYTADDAEETLQRAEHSFSCSKILEIGGVNEEDIPITSVDVNNVYLKSKLSSGDRMNTISAFGEVNVNALFVREDSVDVVTDGYVLNHPTECRYSNFGYTGNGSFQSENRTATLSFDLPDEIQEIKEADIQIGTPTVKGNKPVCGVQLHVIASDENGELLPYSASTELELITAERSDCAASVGLQSYDYSFSPDGRLGLRLNLQLSVFAFDDMAGKLLSDMEASDEELVFPSLTLYFADKEESLWEIAKSFSSDASAIAEENSISGDTLDSAKVLIIPRA